jgi:hypothetical protein
MKRKITSAMELNQAIEELEKKADFRKQELKDHFSGVMENLKPINLIKHAVQSAFSGENKQDLLKGLLGLGSGILGRKLLVGKSGNNMLRKVIGAALEFGVFGMIAKNAGKIKEKGSELIGKVFHRKKSPGPDPLRNRNQSLNYSQKN